MINAKMNNRFNNSINKLLAVSSNEQNKEKNINRKIKLKRIITNKRKLKIKALKIKKLRQKRITPFFYFNDNNKISLNLSERQSSLKENESMYYFNNDSISFTEENNNIKEGNSVSLSGVVNLKDNQKEKSMAITS